MRQSMCRGALTEWLTKFNGHRLETSMFMSSLVLSLALSAHVEPDQSLYPLIRLQDHLPPITEDDRSGGGDSFAFVQAGGEDALPITPPQVEMTAGEDMRPISLSIAFNWVWLGEGRDRRPVWFARLRAAYRDRAIERFADSRRCAGVEQSLAQLNALPALDPRVPTLPDPEATTFSDFGSYLHDNTYQIRLRGLFAGGTYTDRLEVTGGSSAPFAPIVADSLKRLLPCWTHSPPPRA
ncbi:MAG: hypothetical protein DCE92_11295 [Alphaproteobacteria bacterium]|nr:MAG: hypothetical protein DCE92_11295 [Alphaproteobacteria bacterium]